MIRKPHAGQRSGATPENRGDLLGEARRVRQAVSEGRLGVRADVQRFEGDDRDVLEAFNGVLETVAGPLNLAAAYVGRIGKGDIPAKITDHYNGDFDTLKSSLNSCIDSLGGLAEANQVLQRMAVNDHTQEVHGSYPGIFADVARGVNETLKRLRNAAEMAKGVAIGAYRQKLAEVKAVGKRSENDVFLPQFIHMMEAVDALAADTGLLSKAAVEGKLSTRADASRHQGEYQKVIQGVNDTLDAVTGPLNVAATCVARIGKGDIPSKITDEYKGDFNNLKNSLNACIDGLGGLVEANQVLQRLAVNDHSQQVRGSYQGIFADVAKAVNDTQSRLKNVVEMAQGVAVGAYHHKLTEAKAVGKRCENDVLLPQFIAMMEAIDALVADVGVLSKAAVEGRLSIRADASQHQGEYRKVIEGVNATLNAVAAPAEAARTALERVVEGDLTARVAGNFQGDHAVTKDAINQMSEKLSGSMAQIGRDAQALASSSEELSAVSHQMSANAEETAAQSNVVSAAAEQVTKNLQTVATATEEMTASIKEIAKNANEAARVATSAVTTAQTTNATVAKLGESSAEIGQVIKVITSIAQQTNLLAMNATI